MNQVISVMISIIFSQIKNRTKRTIKTIKVRRRTRLSRIHRVQRAKWIQWPGQWDPVQRIIKQLVLDGDYKQLRVQRPAQRIKRRIMLMILQHWYQNQGGALAKQETEMQIKIIH